MESLDPIIQKANTAIAKYSDTEDISSLTFLIIFKALLLLVAIAAVTIKHGYTLKHLLFIGVICVLFLIYRSRMLKTSNKNSQSEGYNRIDPSDKTIYGGMMLDYLVTGMDVKIARVKSVKLFYTILTPLFLICAKEFWSGLIAPGSLIIYLLIMYPLSFWVWNNYFSKEQQKFDRLSHDAITMRADFRKIEQEMSNNVG